MDEALDKCQEAWGIHYPSVFLMLILSLASLEKEEEEKAGRERERGGGGGGGGGGVLGLSLFFFHFLWGENSYSAAGSRFYVVLNECGRPSNFKA